MNNAAKVGDVKTDGDSIPVRLQFMTARDFAAVQIALAR
jgi:hypothetical protein